MGFYEEIIGRLAETFGATTVIVGIVVCIILSIIADWRLFQKAGKSGVLSIIPFYNVFVL